MRLRCSLPNANGTPSRRCAIPSEKRSWVACEASRSCGSTPLAHAEPTVRVEPTLISVLHWGRLLEGELFATSRYVEWAVLMKRSFGFDALRCPRCERRMRVLSTITDSAMVRRILNHLNLPSQPRTAAPARDPTWQPMAFGFDAA